MPAYLGFMLKLIFRAPIPTPDETETLLASTSKLAGNGADSSGDSRAIGHTEFSHPDPNDMEENESSSTYSG